MTRRMVSPRVTRGRKVSRMTVLLDVDSHNRCFHLRTDSLSYVFRVLDNGVIEHLYAGPVLRRRGAFVDPVDIEKRDSSPSWNLASGDMQPELHMFEYPSWGHGDFRTPAFVVRQGNGSRITEFRYEGCSSEDGVSRVAGIPCSFADGSDGFDDSYTLTIDLRDVLIGCMVRLRYAVFPHQDVIARSAEIVNDGSQAVVVESAMSLSLDLPDSDYDLLQLSGAWSRENHLTRTRLRPGVQQLQSVRGASSHQHNPFFMLARPDAGEDRGVVWGFNIIYSGNFRNRIEVDHYDITRVQVGINPEEFSWTLGPGESFTTPQAVVSMSDEGFNGLSARMSEFVMRHVVNQNFARRDRPVLINNWEATYFDFDEGRILDIARRAKDIGVELFVLDDGWFGHRDDDTTSLGDWVANPRKLSGGITSLSDRIHAMGLEFGLWFEPEMISIDSDLHRAHPEWMVGPPERALTPQRNQYVLDMTRPDVVDYLARAMSRIISDARIDYIKWDMNRNITEAYSVSLGVDRQGEFFHRYILGVYSLYERLVGEQPDVLFESCASGGGRFDLGMMYYAPQAWLSDDTDAVERALIQYATSYGYPQSTVGAHVSAVPNHETGRITPLSTRADIAFFGDLGYELDLSAASTVELAEMRDQISFYVSHREVLQRGILSRLASPYEGDGNLMSWQIAADDGSIVIVECLRILSHPNPPTCRIHPRGLEPGSLYVVRPFDSAADQAAHADQAVLASNGTSYYGDELMNMGILMPQAVSPGTGRKGGDFMSRLVVIERI